MRHWVPLSPMNDFSSESDFGLIATQSTAKDDEMLFKIILDV